MAALTVQEIDLDGLALATTAAASGGDTFDNQGDTFLYVSNGGGSSITVTITAQRGPDGLTITNPSGAVAASAIGLFGPYAPQWFNDANGEVNVDYSAVTSVVVAAVKLPEK